jgi:hypothetical protein
MKRTGKTYVVVTDDGPLYKNVFLSWSIYGCFYTTVEDIAEVNEYDFHDTIASAIDRARDADSGACGAWGYPMAVYEVLNFEDAYNNGEEPELVKVHDISFSR